MSFNGFIGKMNGAAQERIKNIILAVLLICMVLLLYFLWQKTTVHKPINLAIKEQEAFKASAIFRPTSVSVCSGEDYYKQAQSWGPRFMVLASDFLNQELTIEEITPAQFDEIMRYPSIRANFNYTVPYEDFCNEFGVKKPAGRNHIFKLSSIGYSKETPGNLFIYDALGGKYYRIYNGADSKPLDKLNDIIDGVNSEDTVQLYKLSRFLGNRVSGDAMLPVYLDVDMPEFEFERDFDIANPDDVRDIAESYFGRNLDFVRKIQEKNGTKIFMYGYGEQTLILYPSGVVEYKEGTDEVASNTDYFGGMQIALNFIAKHGGFDSLKGTGFTPYLFEVEPLSGDVGYRYVFGVKFNEHRVYSEEGMPFEVEVMGERVIYMKRAAIHCERPLAAYTAQHREPQHEPINALAMNYKNMRRILIEEGQFKPEELKTFEALAMKISRIRYGYLIMHGADVLKPAWIVSAGDIDMYFDLYSAEPLGFGIVRGD